MFANLGRGAQAVHECAIRAISLVRQGTYASLLYTVYRKATSIGTLGGWAGATDSSVCAAISVGTRPEFWSATSRAREECANMIYARFDSILVVAEVCVAMYVFVRLVAWYVQHYMLVRPVVMEMRSLRNEIATMVSSGRKRKTS